MSVGSIIVQNRAGETLGSVSGKVMLRLGEGLAWDGSTLSAASSDSPLVAGVAAVKSDGRYVSSVSGASPGAAGDVWVDGDECLSWEPGASSVTLYDLCPSCRTCEGAHRLRRRIEWCHMMLEAFKDASLNTQTVTDARLALMAADRVSDGASCASTDAEYAKYAETVGILSRRLLGQYATMVHLWNYAVSQNNSSTVITTPSGDETGFIVQTKHALPSCGGAAAINCSIVIEPVDVEEGISIYVHTPELEFLPFTSAMTGLSDHVAVTHETATRKVIATNLGPSEYAGTYAVTVKVLPFMYAVLRDRDGNVIDLASVDWSAVGSTSDVVVGETETTTTTQYHLGATQEEYTQLKAPTLEQYRAANVCPTRTDDGENVWKVTVSWIMTGSLEKTFTETYIYTTMRTRKYLAGMLRDTTFVTVTENTPEATA